MNVTFFNLDNYLDVMKIMSRVFDFKQQKRVKKMVFKVNGCKIIINESKDGNITVRKEKK